MVGPPPRRRKEVLFREVRGEGILYHPDRRSAHFLNRTALFIWETCDGDRAEEEIARELCAVFDVSAERAGEDVREALDRFRALDLLQPPG